MDSTSNLGNENDESAIVLYQGEQKSNELAITRYKGHELTVLDEQALLKPSHKARKPPNQPQPMKPFHHNLFTVQDNIIKKFSFDSYDMKETPAAELFRVRTWFLFNISTEFSHKPQLLGRRQLEGQKLSSACIGSTCRSFWICNSEVRRPHIFLLSCWYQEKK